MQAEKTTDFKSWHSYIPILLTLALFYLPYVYPVYLLFYLSLILFVNLAFRNLDKRFFYVVILAFTFRAFIVLLDGYTAIFPFQPDSGYYNLNALKICQNIATKSPLFSRVQGSLSLKSYALFLSLIYSVFGEVTLTARLVNTFLGTLTGIFVYKICLEIFPTKRIAFFAGVLVLFMPSFIVFTSYLLRDSIVLFLTIVMLYHFVLTHKRRHILKNSMIVIFCFLLISIFRIQNLYLYATLYILYFLFVLFRSSIKKSYKLPFLLFLALGLLYLYSRVGDQLFLIITYPFRAQPLRVGGGSAYLQNIEYNSWWDLLKYLPIRFMYFTFGPFIWNARRVFLILAAIEGMFILLTAYLTLKYFWQNRRNDINNIHIFLLLFCLLGLFANSIVDSNFGTSVRHKINYVLIFFIFAGTYFQNKKVRLI